MKSLEEGLRHELRRYPTEQVNQFLSRVWTIYRLARTAVRPLGEAERLKKLKRLHNACEEFLGAAIGASDALNEGEPIGKSVGRLARASAGEASGSRSMISIIDAYLARSEPTAGGSSGDGIDDAWVRVMQVADVLRHQIERLEQSERRGTKRADADGVLAEIARFYRDILGEVPTTTMGGPFYNVAVLLLGQKNVERAVRAAVAALPMK